MAWKLLNVPYCTYSSDQKKVPVFTVKKRPHAIRTTLVVRTFYGHTVFAINCANRSDVSAMGDPYFRFFERGNYYDDSG